MTVIFPARGRCSLQTDCLAPGAVKDPMGLSLIPGEIDHSANGLIRVGYHVLPLEPATVELANMRRCVEKSGH